MIIDFQHFLKGIIFKNTIQCFIKKHKSDNKKLQFAILSVTSMVSK